MTCRVRSQGGVRTTSLFLKPICFISYDTLTARGGSCVGFLSNTEMNLELKTELYAGCSGWNLVLTFSLLDPSRRRVTRLAHLAAESSWRVLEMYSMQLLYCYIKSYVTKLMISILLKCVTVGLEACHKRQLPEYGIYFNQACLCRVM